MPCTDPQHKLARLDRLRPRRSIYLQCHGVTLRLIAELRPCVSSKWVPQAGQEEAQEVVQARRKGEEGEAPQGRQAIQEGGQARPAGPLGGGDPERRAGGRPFREAAQGRLQPHRRDAEGGEPFFDVAIAQQPASARMRARTVRSSLESDADCICRSASPAPMQLF